MREGKTDMSSFSCLDVLMSSGFDVEARCFEFVGVGLECNSQGRCVRPYCLARSRPSFCLFRSG